MTVLDWFVFDFRNLRNSSYNSDEDFQMHEYAFRNTDEAFEK